MRAWMHHEGATRNVNEELMIPTTLVHYHPLFYYCYRSVTLLTNGSYDTTPDTLNEPV